jgi:hypothetical protein
LVLDVPTDCHVEALALYASLAQVCGASRDAIVDAVGGEILESLSAPPDARAELMFDLFEAFFRVDFDMPLLAFLIAAVDRCSDDWSDRARRLWPWRLAVLWISAALGQPRKC